MHSAAAPPRVTKHRKDARPPASRAVVKSEPTAAVHAVTLTKGSPDYVSAVIVAVLMAAIACLALGSVLTSPIRWRRGAAFVADNRVGITCTGAACLLAAAILFALSRG